MLDHWSEAEEVRAEQEEENGWNWQVVVKKSKGKKKQTRRSSQKSKFTVLQELWENIAHGGLRLRRRHLESAARAATISGRRLPGCRSPMASQPASAAPATGARGCHIALDDRGI